MKVLIIGSGGREHALAWKLARGGRTSQIICAPGNPGMAQLGRCVAIDMSDLDAILMLASKEDPNLVVIGPEAPAAAGLADCLHKMDIPVFGPSKAAAQIESSKAFAKALMYKYNVPTARYGRFTKAREACAFLETCIPPYVIKADGLAAGKGVVITENKAEAETCIKAMLDGQFGKASQQIIIEEFLPGIEASFFVLSDGSHAGVPLGGAQDYKRAYDGDTGPNTGGMGAISPAPLLDQPMQKHVMDTIINPTLHGMAQEGCPFRGVLYAGLMIGPDGIARVVEFNARFGDPECQALMVRLEGDILAHLLASATSGLGECQRPDRLGKDSACIVMASGGYPGPYQTGAPISGIEAAEALEGVQVFHAGTALHEGQLVTNGGRVLGITATGTDVNNALQNAYEAAKHIQWQDSFYRRDIGWRALLG